MRYDAKRSKPDDIKKVEAALRKYPKAWIDSAMKRAQKNGETAPKIVIAGQDQLPPKTAEAKYSPGKNTIYLNLDYFNKMSSFKFLKGMPKSRDAWMKRSVVHEFAHFLDDVGVKDRGLTKTATDVGPKRFEPGVFEKRVRARNRSHDPKHYVSSYDQKRNQGKDTGRFAHDEETFAEVVTQWVNGDQTQRDRLLKNPTLGPMTRQVVDYLESGMDPEALVRDRTKD